MIKSDFYFFNVSTCPTTSNMHLVLVTYERYIAIVRPFQYEYRFKLSRVYTTIAFMWLLSVLIQVPYMVSNGYDATRQMCISQPCGSQIALQVFFVATNIILIIMPTVAMLWFYWSPIEPHQVGSNLCFSLLTRLYPLTPSQDG